ncbi:LysM peptidoglycan-binding domain-containing protein [Amycolatopsis pithecellobii]|uniref:LysM peptidoglycan-binding domain-containing protein n=1 Tax=Amycolatopsis pithecellobii TaxID=664692 RepID=A0A6N7YQ19_9PSEU|nr:transglycosylase family protein [Amycolatopsis pithecellobii]MTD55105.1 LysM peptidoglycan-binding domain-containing protein [Amycolatopsis pithecellobii]
MGRHSKPSKTAVVLKRTGATAAIAGATIGGIAIAGGGTASAFPGQAGIVKCESGGNPTIVNNTAAGQAAGRPAGLFQIVTKTWLANGGGQFAPTADKASPAQQQIVADRIYAKQGTAPWECHAGAGPANFSSFAGQGGGGAASPEAAKVKPQAKPQAKQAKPQAKGGEVRKSSPQAAPRPSHGGDYTVVAGDTLSGIAKKLGIPGGWRHLQQLNAQSIPNADLILVGQEIATR